MNCQSNVPAKSNINNIGMISKNLTMLNIGSGVKYNDFNSNMTPSGVINHVGPRPYILDHCNYLGVNNNRFGSSGKF